MVVRVNSEKAIQDDGGTFDGKVIWIVRARLFVTRAFLNQVRIPILYSMSNPAAKYQELGGQ